MHYFKICSTLVYDQMEIAEFVLCLAQPWQQPGKLGQHFEMLRITFELFGEQVCNE